MNNKQKAILYPVDIEALPIIRNKELLIDYDIVGAVSPNSWGFRENDCGNIDGGGETAVILSSNFDKALELCDTVIFMDSYNKIDFNKMIMPKLNRAIEKGKDIICTMSITEEVNQYLISKCNEGKCKYINYYKELKVEPEINKDIEHIYDFNTPVVFIMGLSERTEKFEIQLALRKNLIDMGYNVSQVGTRHYCEMLGFHSFPKFMFSKAITESNKVVFFNHFLKKLEHEEKPDIILVGIPGGVIPYNNQLTNKFGILAYEISCAVQADSAILSVLYEDYSSKFFQDIHNSLKYRFGVEVDAFNFSAAKGKYNELAYTGTLKTLTLNSDFIDKKKNNLLHEGVSIFNILNPKDAIGLTNLIIDNLSQYEGVQEV